LIDFARTRRAYAATLLVLACSQSVARAEGLIIPHLGAVFGGDTTLIDLNRGPGSKKFTFGASGVWLSRGVFGVEGDFGHTPRFFGDRQRSLVLRSAVTTVTGDVIVAVPLAVSRESLRPYFLAGAGWMRARSSDVVGVVSFDSNLWALSLGGGAIGMVTPRSGFRFDVRQFRNLSPDSAASTTSGSTRLSFWRASVGLVLGY
jgi:hypothetical protein